MINCKDIIAKVVTEAHAGARFSVTYQDDWFSHHTLMGEVQCDSNT